MKQRFQHIILLIILALAWSGEVWGQDYSQWIGKSGSGKNESGVWYVLYETGENSIGINESKEFNLLGPGTTLSFDAKRTATGIGNLKVDKYVNGSYTGNPIFDQNPGKVEKTFLGIETSISYVSYGSFNVSDATKIKFYTVTGASYSKYFKNIKVPMAQYIKEPSATTLAFGAGMVDASADKTLTIAWCNVPAMSYSVTGTNSSDVSVSITNNSEAGKYNTATVKVTYKRKVAGTLNATLTISNTYGSYSKTISLTGSASKYDQTISWNNESAIITSLKVDDTQTISASATSSLAVSYTSSNTNVLTVNNSGEITAKGAGSATITVTQAGNYKYNAATSITKTFTVTKHDQTITWTNPNVVNIVNGETVTEAAKGTAPGGTVTYESSNDEVATVNSNGDVTGVSVPAAPGNIVTITARQAGNYKYNPVEATRQFTVINKYLAMFSPSFTVTAGAATLYVDDTETITCTDLGEGFTYNSSDPTVVSISESNGVITLNAKKVGTSTITLTQPSTTTHYAASATYNVTVTRVPNNLKFSLAATEALVDGNIAVTFTDQNNTGTPIIGTITEQTLSSGVNQTLDNETPVITYTNGVITARNAGTAKITFSQAQTDKYAAWTSSTYDITVTKLSNPISITLAGGSATNIKLKYGATASLSYTYANTAGAAPTVTRTSGSYTTYSAGTITAGNAQGTDIYEIRQAETYNYEAGLATFTIRVNNSDEAVGYVLYDESEYSHGTGSGVMHQYTLSGPGETLTYKACRGTAVTIYYNLYVERSTDGNNWTEIQNNTSLDADYKSNDFSCEMGDEAARYVRFRFPAGGTLMKYMKDAKVTRKTYVRESHDTSKDNFGTVYTGSTATSSTITVSYSSTNGGNINISSNNSHFVPSISEITVESNKKATSPGGTQYICGVDGSQTFTVTYTPDPDLLGTESATITIGDLFYSQTITLTATAAKRTNTLTIIEDQSVKVDDVISDVYSSKNNDATITPTIETLEGEGDVIKYNLSTNKITAVGAGTARLTLTQPATDSHYGATKSVTVTVSKYNQTVNWNNDLDDEARTLEVGVSPVLTTNKATASSGLDVTYSSSNPAALAVDATTGDLTALSGPATVTITATQAGNYKYNSASITRTFTVIQKEEVTITTTLSESGTNFFPIGSDDITIRPSAPVTVSALVITGDEGTLTSTFASNTFTLHAVKEGTVTLTLTRDADEGYYALSKTYTIQVVKPVLVLVPTETPVIEFSDYSTVTLSRTLPAGYSSLALPFSTTVTALTGRAANADDWVAQLETVTYSQADGYTLHFKKVTSGDITANQPYVLHLGATVTNPTWTNVEVEEAEETTMTASAGYGDNVGAAGIYSDWSMTSNFTPGMMMNGKYGVVNGVGALKKGGSTAKLNAFSAYITPPASSAGVKVQSAFTDEWGVTTYIKGLPDEGAESEASGDELYDLSGRRIDSRQQPTRGIYVRGGRRVVVK